MSFAREVSGICGACSCITFVLHSRVISMFNVDATASCRVSAVGQIELTGKWRSSTSLAATVFGQRLAATDFVAQLRHSSSAILLPLREPSRDFACNQGGSSPSRDPGRSLGHFVNFSAFFRKRSSAAIVSTMHNNHPPSRSQSCKGLSWLGLSRPPHFLLRVQVLVFLRLVQVLGLLRHGTPGEHPLRVMLLPRSSTGLKSGITTLSRSGKSRRGRKATITYSCGSRIRVGHVFVWVSVKNYPCACLARMHMAIVMSAHFHWWRIACN